MVNLEEWSPGEGWEVHDIRLQPPGPFLVLRDRRMRVQKAWTMPDAANDLPTRPGLYGHMTSDGLPVVLHRTRGGDWINLADGQVHTSAEVRQLMPLDRLVDWSTAVHEVLTAATDGGYLTGPLAETIAEGIREQDEQDEQPEPAAE